MKCSYCDTKGEIAVRPYGPGRTPICVECAAADPERSVIAAMYADEDMKRLRPNIKIIPIPREALSALRDLLGPDFDDSPCDCSVCKANRNERSAYAN